ncbi:GreA/GreB family elongation factor [Luteolibacter ambystomatis]|uniref:Transcription elongation factor GreA n=1 Tax=Luteolibacter ambystomatis TaxID=2824561 RepID=A0A975G5Q2_9BACT|nr:GreA/GreB family elongation factor [Luteolibacter ambystomatis]QUE49282.1 GreA/GreB family elongation factor [Luteolibacter ambystomatis]
MHPDVAKLVEAGRIPKPVGERLTQLSPGNFCVHKSWGAGKVVDWDLPSKKVVIDFERSAAQTMELQFAFQKTEWIPAEDFRAKKVEQLEELRALAKKDPVELIVHLLDSHGGTMTGDALEKELSGAVIAPDDFKKWWESAKKALRESRRVVVPQKRTEALVLRGGDRTPAQQLVADFEAARDLKGMIKALEAIASDIGAFANDQDALRQLLTDIDEAARKSSRVQLGLSLQLLAARDEVVGTAKALELDPSAVRISDLLQTVDAQKLAEEVGPLPSNRQRAIFEAYPAAFGNEWVDRIVQVFDRVGARGVTEIARILVEKKELLALGRHLRSAIARRALGPDALIWICRERNGSAIEVFSPEVGASILNLLENDHLSDGPRKTSRLQTLLTEDKQLLGDLVSLMDINEARNFARRMLECPVFADLEKKSLMARVIKAKPDTAELVSGESKKREEDLLVSWDSLERKKAELDDIIRVRIPQNTKDISIAREYGDLRENFEYKSAKDYQKFLGNRKAELQKEISRARGTDFKGSDASAVNIGTVVTFTDGNGKEVVYSVLGAWDSDPEKSYLSYLSELGASFLGLKPGDTVEARDLTTDEKQTLTVRSIAAFNP